MLEGGGGHKYVTASYTTSFIKSYNYSVYIYINILKIGIIKRTVLLYTYKYIYVCILLDTSSFG